jgi:hypothetical protein
MGSQNSPRHLLKITSRRHLSRVKDTLRSGRPSTSRSEENAVLVRGMFIHSPRIWLEKHRWTCLHSQWRTATLCTERAFLFGSEVSVTLTGTRTSRMACKKSRSHALWLLPVGLGKGRGVPDKNSHNWITGGPDSEGYHQRPTRLPAEDCRFHPRSFEEAGGCRRCLHLI